MMHYIRDKTDRPFVRCLIVVILLVVILVFQLLTLRRGHGWGDFAIYLVHTRNIIEGRPYAEHGYIFNPAIAPLAYPPVFPLLLVPFYAVFGPDLYLLRIVLVLTTVGTLIVCYFLFRPHLPFGYVISLIAVLGFNPWFQERREQLTADLPFMFFATLSLYLIQRTYFDSNVSPAGGDWKRGLLLGFACYLAYGTRTQGLMLIGILLVSDLWGRKTWKPSGLALATLLMFGALAGLQTTIMPRGSGYIDQLEAIRLAAYFERGWQYLQELNLFWQNGHWELGARIMTTVLTAGAFLGYGVRVRQRITAIELAVPAHLIPLFVFHVVKLNYAVVLLPLYVFFILVYWHTLATWVANRFGIDSQRMVAGLVLILVMVIGVVYVAEFQTMSFAPIRSGPDSPEAVELWKFIDEETPPDSVFIARRPRAVTFYTDRVAGSYRGDRSVDAFEQFAVDIGADYIIVDKGNEEGNVQALIEQDLACGEPVFANDRYTVYEADTCGNL